MPRPILMKNAARFMRWNRARFMKPSVSGVCGTVRITKSARGSSVVERGGAVQFGDPGGGAARRSSTRSRVMPNALASRATSPPMPPTPTTSAVASGRCTTSPCPRGIVRHSRRSCCGR